MKERYQKEKLLSGALGSSQSVDYKKRAQDIVDHIELWTAYECQKAKHQDAPYGNSK